MLRLAAAIGCVSSTAVAPSSSQSSKPPTGRVCACAIVAPCAAAPEPRVAVTLAQAVLKGDKMDDGGARRGDDRRRRDSADHHRANRVVRRRTGSWQASRTMGTHCRVVRQAMRSRCRSPDSGPEAPSRLNAAQSAISRVRARRAECRIRAVARRGARRRAPGGPAWSLVPKAGGRVEELEAAATVGRLITLGGRTLRADAMALVTLAALFARWREY